MAKIQPLPSHEMIKRLREERLLNGFTFPLTATSVGLDDVIYARVRRISSLDEAAINQLPQDMQKVVWDGLQEFQEQQKASADLPDPQSLVEAMANNKKILATANAWCRASFIHPKLVMTEAEITDENTWLVESVDAEDRVALFMASLDADSPQVKKLKMFRPEWGQLAPNGEARAMAAEALHVVEPEGAGV